MVYWLQSDTLFQLKECIKEVKTIEGPELRIGCKSKDDRRARVANRLQKRDSPCLKECIKKSQLKDQCGVSVALDALSSLKECV